MVWHWLVVAVSLLLVLIAVIVVLMSRWCHRRKRRRTRLQHTSCAVDADDAFDPCIVDDDATQKLSCSGQSRENGLCQVCCSHIFSSGLPLTWKTWKRWRSQGI